MVQVLRPFHMELDVFLRAPSGQWVSSQVPSNVRCEGERAYGSKCRKSWFISSGPVQNKSSLDGIGPTLEKSSLLRHKS